MTNAPSAESPLTERQLLGHWNTVRLHLVVSQLAPTFLLIVTVALLDNGLASAPFAVRIAALGILLASGILGALVQISAAGEADAVVADLKLFASGSALTRRIIGLGRFTNVVRFGTPTIFIVVFIALTIALFGPVE